MFTILLTLLLQTAPTTAPATQPTLEFLRSREQTNLRQSMQSLSALPPMKLAETVSLTFDRDTGLLLADSPIASTDGAHRIELLDLPGLTQMNVGQSNNGGRWIDFQHIDFTTPSAITTLLQIFARDDYLMIAYDFTGTLEDQRVQFIQSPRMAEAPGEVVRLYVERFDANTEDPLGKVNIKSDRFDSLLRDHPAETREYLLAPLFSRKLHQAVLRAPAGEAWQVLGDAIPPPAETRKRVDALIAELDSEEFAKRESAAEELRKLGAVGAMVLRTVDVHALSEEQRQTIETTLASYSRLPEDQIATYQKDPLFLIGVLYSDESPLWLAAMEKLGMKSPAAGNVTQIQARLAGDQALAAILRESSPSTQPATQPAERP